MKKWLTSLSMAILITVSLAGCTIDKPTNAPEHSMIKSGSDSNNDNHEITPDKQNQLNQLISHSAEAMEIYLTRNHGGEIGDFNLWQNGIRQTVKLDYIRFHELFFDELTSNHSGAYRQLWDIDEAYINALKALQLPDEKYLKEDPREEKKQSDKNQQILKIVFDKLNTYLPNQTDTE